MACPDRRVVDLQADGSALYTIQSLWTQAREGLDVVTIVFNNHSFGNVLRDQELQYGGRTIGSRFENPDFVRLAESFGVAARRVREPRELQKALELELAAARPALIEVELTPGAEASPWPYIHMRRRPSETLRG